MSLDTAIQPPTADRPARPTSRPPSASRRRCASSSGPDCGPPPRSRASACAPCTSPTAPPASAASPTPPTRPPPRSPRPSALAATWDVDLADEVGHVFAAEARRHGVDVVLAPQVNLQRTPVGGRHFECYSEDPLLTGAIAVHVVRSAQDRGVGHVRQALRRQRLRDRSAPATWPRVDERTLREVYLAPFEQLVHEAQAWSVMSAYSGHRRRHHRRDRRRAPPAAHRRAQGRVGLRRRRR